MKKLGPWYWSLFLQRLKMLGLVCALLYALVAVTVTRRTDLISRYGGLLRIPSAERDQLIALNLGILLIMMVCFTLVVPVTYLVTLYHRYHDQGYHAPRSTR